MGNDAALDKSTICPQLTIVLTNSSGTHFVLAKLETVIQYDLWGISSEIMPGYSYSRNLVTRNSTAIES